MAQTLTRTFPDGDYPARLNAIFAAYMAALKDEQKTSPDQQLMGEDLPSDELNAEYTALKAEAEADARDKDRVVTLRALGRKLWRPLKEAHPVRIGDDHHEDDVRADRLAGVNTESVEDDLVHRSIDAPARLACSRPPNDNRACTAETTCTNRAAFDEWADDLAEGEWKLLVRDAWSLVNVAQVDPKALPSLLTPSSDGN